MVESAPFARWLPGGASHGRRLPSPGLVGRLELASRRRDVLTAKG